MHIYIYIRSTTCSGTTVSDNNTGIQKSNKGFHAVKVFLGKLSFMLSSLDSCLEGSTFAGPLRDPFSAIYLTPQGIYH